MKIKKLLLSFLFIINLSNAQEFKQGKVSIAELEQKQHPKDSSAVAAVLFKKGEVRFDYSQDNGFVMLTEVKTRIKIYKKEGFEFSNQNIMYYVGNSNKENILIDDAVTYNLVGGKIEKTKLKSDGEFDEKINKYRSRKKITMPNIKEGSVIEFSYLITSPNIGSMRDWDFQTTIPVNFSEFKTFVPEYFEYKPNQKGFIFPKVMTDKKERTISYLYKPTFTAGGNNSTSQEKLVFVETITTSTAQNLPAMKEEGYVNNIENYVSSVSNEILSIRYPNQPYKNYATNWETVTKKIYDYDDFGQELNKTGYFEDDLKAVISSISARDEKISAIYNFVKSKVKWNKYYGYACDDGVKKAYKESTGNAAEINLMLTAMLRYAQIEANPVLISTRSNGIALFPSRAAFNYVIAGVETPEGLILLDATERFSTPNILPLRDINWYGRLIRKDGTSTEVDLTPKTVAKEVSNMTVSVSSDGSINGKIRKQYTNHIALEFRDENLILSKDAYLEKLEKKCNDIEISEYVRDNDTEVSLPIVETFSFKDAKGLEIINNKIYISPLFFLSTKENPFKQEVREYPIDFGYPEETKYNINIDIPEGYKIETLPVATSITTGENVGNFRYNISNTDEKIQIVITSAINAPIVPADFYDILKEYFQKMIDKQNEKIVLVKK
jgi:Transglutaminase-like superfamily